MRSLLLLCVWVLPLLRLLSGSAGLPLRSAVRVLAVGVLPVLGAGAVLLPVSARAVGACVRTAVLLSVAGAVLVLAHGGVLPSASVGLRGRAACGLPR